MFTGLGLTATRAPVRSFPIVMLPDPSGLAVYAALVGYDPTFSYHNLSNRAGVEPALLIRLLPEAKPNTDTVNNSYRGEDSASNK